MSIQKKTNQKRLLEALDHVDDRYVAELVDGLKLPKEETKVITGKKSFAKSIRYAVAVAACALLLGAAIPAASTLIGRISPANPTGNPAGNVDETTAEVIETKAPETEPVVPPADLMVEYGWSPKEITNEEVDEIIAAYLKKDTDPNKYAYTYSVTCYDKYSAGKEKPVYAVMINSDRWTYEEKERVEEVFYNAGNPNLHIDFIFPSDQPLLIYTAGKFYTLNEAMEQSLLSFAQLITIRWGDRASGGGGFGSFVYPIWLSHSELVEIVYSNPERGAGGWDFRCYGNFDGKYVIFADQKYKVYEPKETTEVVNGLKFVYPNENKLQVCANGTFYSLAEAFEKKILTADDLAEVHKIYSLEEELVNNYLAKYTHKFPDSLETQKEYFIAMIQGIYDDAVVAVVSHTAFNDITDTPAETVNGITFEWVMQYDMHVYKDGEFYSLTEAFEKSFITAEQLEEVHSSYNTAFGEMFGHFISNNTSEP